MHTATFLQLSAVNRALIISRCWSSRLPLSLHGRQQTRITNPQISKLPRWAECRPETLHFFGVVHGGAWKMWNQMKAGEEGSTKHSNSPLKKENTSAARLNNHAHVCLIRKQPTVKPSRLLIDSKLLASSHCFSTPNSTLRANPHWQKSNWNLDDSRRNLENGACPINSNATN